MTQKREATLAGTSSTGNMEQQRGKKFFMVRKSTAPKVEKISIRNVPSHETDIKRSVPLTIPPQPSISELIELAKAAKLAKEARLLEEKRGKEGGLLKEKIGEEIQMVELLDFDTFASKWQDEYARQRQNEREKKLISLVSY